MKRSREILLVAAMSVLPLVYAGWLYPSLPKTVPTHFNASGEADDWGSKSTIFLAPAILSVIGILLYFLFANIGRIDPKARVPSNDKVFGKLGVYTVLFLSALSLILINGTAHPGVSIIRILFPYIGLAFVGIGVYMPRLHQNYFAGLRTPWALEDPYNWEATHRLGGKVWSIGGVVIMVAGILFPVGVLLFVFPIAVLLMVMIPFLHSWRVYVKYGKKR